MSQNRTLARKSSLDNDTARQKSRTAPGKKLRTESLAPSSVVDRKPNARGLHAVPTVPTHPGQPADNPDAWTANPSLHAAMGYVADAAVCSSPLDTSSTSGAVSELQRKDRLGAQGSVRTSSGSLRLSQPGDRLEQEADSIAARDHRLKQRARNRRVSWRHGIAHPPGG